MGRRRKGVRRTGGRGGERTMGVAKERKKEEKGRLQLEANGRLAKEESVERWGWS